MKLVIDIPEQMYLNARADTLCGADILVKAIKNGTPLPRGHGRLKDVDSIFNVGFPKADINAEYEENIKEYPYWRTDITGFQSILKNAPTIIEADTESEK